MRGSSGAASVPPQRRGRGGGAWEGQVAQQRGAGTAAACGGAAVAPGEARWRGDAAEAWRWRKRAVVGEAAVQSIAASRPQPRAAQEQRS